MLSGLTRLDVNWDLKKPRDYLIKRDEDFHKLLFEKYLEKYYKEMPAFENEVWEKVQAKLVEPAFDVNRHQEMVFVMGYVSVEVYDFMTLQEMYLQVNSYNVSLSDDVKKFIGFMAGSGFFKRNNITLNQWFNMGNWFFPYRVNEKQKTIVEILSYQYGINYFKVKLLELPHWDRR